MAKIEKYLSALRGIQQAGEGYGAGLVEKKTREEEESARKRDLLFRTSLEEKKETRAERIRRKNRDQEIIASLLPRGEIKSLPLTREGFVDWQKAGFSPYEKEYAPRPESLQRERLYESLRNQKIDLTTEIANIQTQLNGIPVIKKMIEKGGVQSLLTDKKNIPPKALDYLYAVAEREKKISDIDSQMEELLAVMRRTLIPNRTAGETPSVIPAPNDIQSTRSDIMPSPYPKTVSAVAPDGTRKTIVINSKLGEEQARNIGYRW